MLILNVAGCASRAQLLEALTRLRKTPSSKAVQAYADLLLAQENRQGGEEYQRYEADCSRLDATEYRR